MKTLCIIPARAGSKRIPNKNFLCIDGLPAYQHQINKAYKAGFDRVVLATDHEYFNGDIYFRQPVSDDQTLAELITEMLPRYPGYDVICVLYSLALFAIAEHLKEGLLRIQDINTNSVYAVNGNGKHAGQFYIFKRQAFTGENIHPQLSQLVYCYNAIDIDTPEDLEKAKRLLGVEIE